MIIVSLEELFALITAVAAMIKGSRKNGGAVCGPHEPSQKSTKNISGIESLILIILWFVER